MKTKFYQIVLLCLTFVGLPSAVNAQTLGGTDPYASFDYTTDLTQTKSVTQNSVHKYTITGDATVTTASTFIWKVGEGTLVADADGTAGLPSGVTDNGDGTYTITGDASNEASIFIKWDVVGSDHYVAVYEVTSYGCYNSADPYRGYKISIANQLEIWFAATDTQSDICSGDNVIVRIELPDPTGPNASSYYPMKVVYSVVDKTNSGYGASPFTLDLTTAHAIEGTGVDAGRYFHTIDLGAINVDVVTVDDNYTFTLESVTDAYNAPGAIIDNAGANKYPSHKINVRHLPQTGTMAQN